MQQFEAVHQGHVEIGQNQVGLVAQHLKERRQGIIRPGNLISVLLQDQPKRVEDGGVIINDEDLLSAGLSGGRTAFGVRGWRPPGGFLTGCVVHKSWKTKMIAPVWWG